MKGFGSIMKKLLFSVSLLAGLAAFAAADEIDASAQTFGVLPITTGEANVIVAVPWVVATNVNDVDTIPVADIIKTANLTEGDWVRVWNTDRKLFNVWTLTDVEGILTWVPGDTVSEAGIAAGEGADITSLKRGDALILHRQNPKSRPADDSERLERAANHAAFGRGPLDLPRRPAHFRDPDRLFGISVLRHRLAHKADLPLQPALRRVRHTIGMDIDDIKAILRTLPVGLMVKSSIRPSRTAKGDTNCRIRLLRGTIGLTKRTDVVRGVRRGRPKATDILLVPDLDDREVIPEVGNHPSDESAEETILIRTAKRRGREVASAGCDRKNRDARRPRLREKVRKARRLPFLRLVLEHVPSKVGADVLDSRFDAPRQHRIDILVARDVRTDTKRRIVFGCGHESQTAENRCRHYGLHQNGAEEMSSIFKLSTNP